MRVRVITGLVLLLNVATAASAAQDVETVRLFDFEEGPAGWSALQEGQLGPAGCRTADAPLGQGRCLQIEVALPGTSGAGVALQKDAGAWHRFTRLSLRVFLPAEAPEKVQALVYLKDTDLFYYQHFRPAYLPRGRWTDLKLDLTARSTDWEPAGHFEPWDGYCRADVSEFGVKVIGDERYQGPLYVDSVELTRDADDVPARNVIYNLRANAAEVGRYEKFEASFNLARTYSNPFDPEVVDVRGRFVRPDGTEVSVPGFFYQGYLRRMAYGAERLVPMGRSQWKVRFAPTQLGTYHYYVEVDDGELLRSELGTFRCAPSENHGFVRISKTDPDYLEFDDGTFYYPIGHNIAAVDDQRAHVMGVAIPSEQRTYAYDRFLTRMGASGINFGRVWMSPWSFGIEWSKAYDSQFRGLGRYSLQNAWRLDHVVETAAQNGVYLMLLLTSHGELGDLETDFYGSPANQLQGSPYWSRLGGPLQKPLDIYTSAEGIKYYKRKVRYIVARWGYATSIMAWELLNEVDLGFHRDPNAYRYGVLSARFVQQMLQHIQPYDPAGHLTTSGFVWHQNPYARPTLSLDEMTIFAAHIFDGNLGPRLVADGRFIKEQFGKIMLVTEAGATPFATDPDLTARLMHRTLWTSAMLPMAGAACPWWWVLIDQKDLYGDFAGLAAFMAGEDRRGMGYRQGAAAVEDAEGKRRLSPLCLRNETRGFCWVHDPASFSQQADWAGQEPAAARVTIPDLPDGRYKVEVWDTRSGSVIAGRELAGQGGALTFDLPPFVMDVACKFARLGGPDRD